MSKRLIIILIILFILLSFWNNKYVSSQSKRHQDLDNLVNNVVSSIESACNRNNVSYHIELPEILIQPIHTLAGNKWRMRGWNIKNWIEHGYIYKETQIKPVIGGVSTPVTYYYITRKLCQELENLKEYLQDHGNNIELLEAFEIYNWQPENENDKVSNQERRLTHLKNYLVSWTAQPPHPILLTVNTNQDIVYKAGNLQQRDIISSTIDERWLPSILIALNGYKIKKEAGEYIVTPTSTSCVNIKITPFEKNKYGIEIVIVNEKAKEKLRGLIQDISSTLQKLNSIFRSQEQNSRSKIQFLWENAEGFTPEGQKYIEDLSKLKLVHDDFVKTYGKLDGNIAEILRTVLAPGCNTEVGLNAIDGAVQKLKRSASSTSSFIVNTYQPTLQEIKVEIKLPTITVETTSLPIAVIPPIVFDREHKGTSSFKAITPERIFNEIKDFIFKIAPTIFILLVIVGAIFYLLAPVNIQNISTGSEYIKWAVMGYFLLLVIAGVLTVIKTILGAP